MEEEKKKVEPMELCVPTASVIRSHDFGSYEIKETETGILFHVKGGYDLFVQPRMASLYMHLAYILDGLERLKEMDEKEREIFDAIHSATVTNLEIPLFMASDDIALFEVASKALSELDRISRKALNADLTPETPKENGEFQRTMDAFEAMGAEMDKPVS